MRKKTWILGIIDLVCIIFSLIAWSNTRGLQIYLVPYSIGKIYMMAYLPATVIAVILLLIFISMFKKDWKVRKEKKMQAKEAVSEIKPQEQNVVICKCPQCGTEYRQEQKFCTQCGAKLQ